MEVVDPEVRAFVSSLVSALGGSGSDEHGCYVLGDDALACLKDLKRWLKLYDEKLNRLDVARVLGESNIVNGDLVPILAAWPDNAIENRTKARIALSCMELLVPLTWPIDKGGAEMTVNHHRHIPYLRLAQLHYKSGILSHSSHKILRQAIRIALPSIAKEGRDRVERDEGVIKLVLYFLRNLVIITSPKDLPAEDDEEKTSRSSTIAAFHQQDVFHLLLALSSGMGENFNTQDVIVLEILYHLLKGIDPAQVFMTTEQLENVRVDHLSELMVKEKAMKRVQARNAPTRHNRFGTMIWVKGDGDRLSSVSGQGSLLSNEQALEKMDSSKKWKRPNFRGKASTSRSDFDEAEMLTAVGARHLRVFVEDFLDAGFNPLFNHMRKAIEREAERISDHHTRQFFYLAAWFLEAERLRQQNKKSTTDPAADKSSAGGFELIASVLTQETFITLTRFLRISFDNKEWADLNAGMRFFTQVLLMVQEMAHSPSEDDREIAENTQNRLFYEESTHDLLLQILRTYKSQGFGYLDASTELVHVFLNMLETYSKQNADMQIRSKRATRKKKQPTGNANTGDDYDGSDVEAEQRAEAQRTTRERKFDFTRFSAKFLNQSCIDTFVALAVFYRDLSVPQLKRIHRFFHRVAFKLDFPVLLYRVDIIRLFMRIVQGKAALDASCPIFREWEELVKQLIKQLVRKLDDCPELFVEMLFSKTAHTARVLQYGPASQTVTPKMPKVAAEWEVRGDHTREEQISIVVTAHIEQNKGDDVHFVKTVLSKAVTERTDWEDKNPSTASPDIEVEGDTSNRSKSLLKSGQLRLLLVLCQLPLPAAPEDCWLIPGSVLSQELSETLEWVKKYENETPDFAATDGGMRAEDLLRRKLKPRERPEQPDALSSDSEQSGSEGENDFLPGGPTPTAPLYDQEKSKKSKGKRRRLENKTEGEEKKKDEREIKSSLFIHDSDDETDDERDRQFYEREEQLRAAVKRGLLSVPDAIKSKNKKQKAPVVALDSDVEGFLHGEDDETDAASGEADTPPTSATLSQSLHDDQDQEVASSVPKRKRTLSMFVDDGDSDASEIASSTANRSSRAVSLDVEETHSLHSSAVSAPASSFKRRRMVISDDEDDDE